MLCRVVSAVGSEGGLGGSCAGAGGDREGGEERAPSPQQPAGEQGDAAGRWPLPHGL